MQTNHAVTAVRYASCGRLESHRAHAVLTAAGTTARCPGVQSRQEQLLDLVAVERRAGLVSR